MVAVDGGRHERWIQSHWAPWLKLYAGYILQLHVESCDEFVAKGGGGFAQSSSRP